MVYAIIVLYNKSILDSNTYNSIKRRNNRIKLIVFDNSTMDYGNKELCKENNIDYLTTNENIGLSRAYNYIIDKYNFKDNDYIIILDDDTQLNEEYIEEAQAIARENKKSVSLPLIMASDRMISPVKVTFNCRIKTVEDINSIKPEKISAINTGMVLKANIFKKIKYNEKLFLDYVDHDFMKQVRNEKIDINIMHSIINQNFSRFQKSGIHSDMTRFKIFKKDYKVYCEECHNMLFYYISIFKHRLSLACKYKSLRFLIVK